jgi:hypothetical protein
MYEAATSSCDLHRRRKTHFPLMAAVAATAVVHSTGALAANNLVNVETVSNYASFPDCCGGSGATAPCDELGLSNSSGANFLNELLHSGFNPGHFVAGGIYVDTDVWDQDFYDSELTHNTSTADDNYTFDAPGTAIAFFQGHGLVAIEESACCKTPSDCPVVAGAAAACVSSPLNRKSNPLCPSGNLRTRGNASGTKLTFRPP